MTNSITGGRGQRPGWALFSLGVKFATNRTLKRKAMVANMCALVAMLNIGLYDLLYLATGNPALARGVWASVPSYFALAAVWWLSGRGHLAMARRLLLLSISMLVFGLVLLSQGTGLATHFYFLLFAAATPILVPSSDRSTLVLSLAGNFLLFLAFQFFGWPPQPGVELLSSGTVQAFQWCVYVTTALSFLVVLLISELTATRNEAQLRQWATTDVLTGVMNRHAFLAALEHEVAVSQRSGSPLSVAMIDIDHFKAVNDVHGHLAGDAALRHVAHVLRDTVRQTDWLARFGGEEFVVLMPNTSLEQAQPVAEQMRLAVCGPIAAPAAAGVKVTISIGLARQLAGEEFHATLERADQGVYAAKNQGRDRVVSLP